MLASSEFYGKNKKNLNMKGHASIKSKKTILDSGFRAKHGLATGNADKCFSNSDTNPFSNIFLR